MDGTGGAPVRRVLGAARVVLAGALPALVLAAGCAVPTGVDAPAPAPSGPGPPADAQPARVVGHTDGDTLRVRAVEDGPALRAGTETSVRLLEVDTPESLHPDLPVQCHAAAAGRQLRRLAPLGSTVLAVRDTELRDRYGRTLLYLWNEQGTFVNLALVRGGHARAVLYRPNDEHIGLLRDAEAAAREAGRGLWGACARFGQPAG